MINVINGAFMLSLYCIHTLAILGLCLLVSGFTCSSFLAGHEVCLICAVSCDWVIVELVLKHNRSESISAVGKMQRKRLILNLFSNFFTSISDHKLFISSILSLNNFEFFSLSKYYKCFFDLIWDSFMFLWYSRKALDYLLSK